MRLGEILVAANACDEAAIERGLEQSRISGSRLGSALIELGLVSSDIVAAALGKQHGINPARESNFQTIDEETLALLTGAQAHAHRALPLGIQRATGELAVAMCDPLDNGAIDAIRDITGKDIIVAAASEHRILCGLTEHYGPADTQPLVPEEEMLDLELDLELAPSPIATKKKTAPIDVIKSPIVFSNPPAPETISLPEATIANTPPAFDVKKFLGTGPGIAAAAALAVALLILGKCTYDWLTDKEIPVSGHFEADEVDLQMTLPATGWIYAPAADMSESAGFAEVSVAVLYRGGTLKKPDDLLALMRVTVPFPAVATERDFQQLIDQLNAGPSMQMGNGEFSVLEHECSMSDRRNDLTAECVGSIRYEGASYDFTAFLWFARDGSVIATLFLTKGEFLTFEDEIDSIIQSIDIQ